MSRHTFTAVVRRYRGRIQRIWHFDTYTEAAWFCWRKRQEGRKSTYHVAHHVMCC